MINRDLLETGRTDEQNAEGRKDGKRDRQSETQMRGGGRDSTANARLPLRWGSCDSIQKWLDGARLWNVCIERSWCVCVCVCVCVLTCEHFIWHRQHGGRASVCISRCAAHTDRCLDRSQCASAPECQSRLSPPALLLPLLFLRSFVLLSPSSSGFLSSFPSVAPHLLPPLSATCFSLRSEAPPPSSPLGPVSHSRPAGEI